MKLGHEAKGHYSSSVNSLRNSFIWVKGKLQVASGKLQTSCQTICIKKVGNLVAVCGQCQICLVIELGSHAPEVRSHVLWGKKEIV